MDSRIRLLEKNSDFIYWDIEQPSGVAERGVTPDGCFCVHTNKEPYRAILCLVAWR